MNPVPVPLKHLLPLRLPATVRLRYIGASDSENWKTCHETEIVGGGGLLWLMGLERIYMM
jgi:hypothetical protein